MSKAAKIKTFMIASFKASGFKGWCVSGDVAAHGTAVHATFTHDVAVLIARLSAFQAVTQHFRTPCGLGGSEQVRRRLPEGYRPHGRSSLCSRRRRSGLFSGAVCLHTKRIGYRLQTSQALRIATLSWRRCCFMARRLRFRCSIADLVCVYRLFTTSFLSMYKGN